MIKGANFASDSLQVCGVSAEILLSIFHFFIVFSQFSVFFISLQYLFLSALCLQQQAINPA